MPVSCALKDFSSPYFMTNRPTYVEGGQCAASSELAAATKPKPKVRAEGKGKTSLPEQSEELTTPTPKGAGFRFGRRGTVRMMRSNAAQTAAASRGCKSRVIEVRVSADMSHWIRQNKRIAIETHGEMWVDTGADKTCAGAGFKVLAY